MQLTDLSIVIVSYNVRELLTQCLGSIEIRSSAITREVIVVDNASVDQSARMVREQFPRTRLIENESNRGFAFANNQGFAKANGRYVIMLNPDTRVCEGALETLVRFMDSHPRAGACGGKLLYEDNSLQHSAFRFPTLAQMFLDFFPINWRLTQSRLNGRYPRQWYERGHPFRIDHPLGADFMVRRQTAEKVGWLDERFFIYCEEIDWAIRIRQAGWEIWCVPSAEIIHYEARSTRQNRAESFLNLWRARLQLFEKHYSRGFRLAARSIVRMGIWNLVRQAHKESRRGSITPSELQQRLGAYQRVNELLRASSRSMSNYVVANRPNEE